MPMPEGVEQAGSSLPDQHGVHQVLHEVRASRRRARS